MLLDMAKDDGKILCPNCGAELELDELLTHQIREGLKGELQEEVARREAAVAAKARDVQKLQASLDATVSEQVKLKLSEAEKKAAAQLKDQYELQLKDLNENLVSQKVKLQEFQEQELALRKAKRDLEEQAEAQKLQVARTLDEERKKISDAVLKQADEAHRMKDLEKDKKLQDLSKALEDAKRKAEQGSMETQGEVLEQDFEQQLAAVFLHDAISPVPKGIRGADVIQKVQTPLGVLCGTLLWETKNTKAWSSQWIAKLKDDMIAVRADVAILVTVALPEGLQRFGQVDGVWVSDPLSAIPLASALRTQLEGVQRERSLSVGKNEKMEVLYQYLAGNEFRQKIEGIVQAFTDMQDQLNAEKRAMTKHWAKREKQIERVINNTTGMYGDMQGILGAQLPEIRALELDPDEPPALE
jgi:hypothetical protein